MKTFKLHLLRHGLTQGNLDGIYVGGESDLPLCEEGVEQLELLNQRFEYPRVNTVFTSPMLRARQTADVLFPEAGERYVIEQLREQRIGEFEGRGVEELVNDADFKIWLDPAAGYTPKGGESGAVFNQRCADAMMTMMNHLATNDISEAVCVTHGGVIMSMMSQLALPRKPALEWICDTGTGFTVGASAAMLMRDNIVEALDIVPLGYLAAEGEA